MPRKVYNLTPGTRKSNLSNSPDTQKVRIHRVPRLKIRGQIVGNQLALLNDKRSNQTSDVKKSSVQLRSYRKRKMAERNENNIFRLKIPKLAMAEEIQQQIDDQIRMREGAMKLMSACSTLNQALETSKNLLTINARILGLMSALQKKKKQHVLEEWNRQRSSICSESSVGSCTGRVAISDIRVPLMWKDNVHFTGKTGDQSYYAFALLRCGDQVRDTPLYEVTSSDTDMYFDHSLIFDELSADFKMDFEVYYTVITTNEAHGIRTPVRTPMHLRTSRKTIQFKAPKFCLAGHVQLNADDIKKGMLSKDLIMGGQGASGVAVLGDIHEFPIHPLELWGQIVCVLAAQPKCMTEEGLNGHCQVKVDNAWKGYFCKVYTSAISCWLDESQSSITKPSYIMSFTDVKKVSQLEDDHEINLISSNNTILHSLKFEDSAICSRWTYSLRTAVVNFQSWKHAATELMHIEEIKKHRLSIPTTASFYDQIKVEQFVANGAVNRGNSLTPLDNINENSGEIGLTTKVQEKTSEDTLDTLTQPKSGEPQERNLPAPVTLPNPLIDPTLNSPTTSNSQPPEAASNENQTPKKPSEKILNETDDAIAQLDEVISKELTSNTNIETVIETVEQINDNNVQIAVEAAEASPSNTDALEGTNPNDVASNDVISDTSKPPEENTVDDNSEALTVDESTAKIDSDTAISDSSALLKDNVVVDPGAKTINEESPINMDSENSITETSVFPEENMVRDSEDKTLDESKVSISRTEDALQECITEEKPTTESIIDSLETNVACNAANDSECSTEGNLSSEVEGTNIALVTDVKISDSDPSVLGTDSSLPGTDPSQTEVEPAQPESEQNEVCVSNTSSEHEKTILEEPIINSDHTLETVVISDEKQDVELTDEKNDEIHLEESSVIEPTDPDQSASLQDSNASENITENTTKIDCCLENTTVDTENPDVDSSSEKANKNISDLKELYTNEEKGDDTQESIESEQKEELSLSDDNPYIFSENIETPSVSEEQDNANKNNNIDDQTDVPDEESSEIVSAKVVEVETDKKKDDFNIETEQIPSNTKSSETEANTEDDNEQKPKTKLQKQLSQSKVQTTV